MPKSTRMPVIISPCSALRSRNGSAVTMSANSTEATVAPRKVARPPDNAAPPRTAAVMLASA